MRLFVLVVAAVFCACSTATSPSNAQQRVTGSCSDGGISAINSDGTVMCSQSPAGVVAGTGLSSSGSPPGPVTLSVSFGGNGAQNTVSRSDHKHFLRTIIVSPGSSPTQSGTNLTGALGAITDASSANPYLVKIEPGVYDLGSGSLTMQSYVDVEGSGRDTTTVTSTVDSATAGTVNGVIVSELRELTVQNTGSGSNALGIYANNATLFMMSRVNVNLFGSASNPVGVSLNQSPGAVLDSMTVDITGGANVVGVQVAGSDQIQIRHSQIYATGSGSIGVSLSESDRPLLVDTTVDALPSGTAYLGSSTASDTAVIRNSALYGSPYYLATGGAFNAFLASDQLYGTSVAFSTGVIVCANVYNASFTAFTSTCP